MENATLIEFETKFKKLLHEIEDQNKQSTTYLSIIPITEEGIIRDAMPPTQFATKNSQCATPELLYRMYKSECRLVRSILEFNKFSITETHDWNIMWMGGSAKPYRYSGLNEFQRINHFPNTNEITRKDKLCINISQMQENFGTDLFNVIPSTFILPDEFGDFYAEFAKNKGTWIVKPCASSRGRGIYLVDDMANVPMEEP